MKCKICKAGQDNPMHLFGHHFFVPDTLDVELPEPACEKNEEAE